MVDKYGTGQDPDCYPGTSTLINSLNIHDDQMLEAAERDITGLCAVEIEFRAPPYDFDYLCDIHKSLFQDIYPWAGQIRQLDVSKGNTRFCNVRYIATEINKLFSRFTALSYFQKLDRDELIVAIAELYGDLNIIHPFRDGNGRTQRIFFEHAVTNAGFEIYWVSVEQKEWVDANIAAVTCNYGPLELIFERCIGKPIRGI